jgi:hypothetical protein
MKVEETVDNQGGLILWWSLAVGLGEFVVPYLLPLVGFWIMMIMLVVVGLEAPF